MEKTPRLLLWDIDGTLIQSGHAGEAALKRVATERFGDDFTLEGIEIAGRTDKGIVRQILQKRKVAATSEAIASILDSYVGYLRDELPKREGCVLPGVREILEHTAAQPHLTNALLTGNIVRGAQLKLEHYGLWQYFAFGAFADDHHDRNQLGPFAHRRARETTGHDFAPDRVDVIGDTEHDIACGKAFGARTVAVATGSRSRAELVRHGPDFCFADLASAKEVMNQLGW